MALLSLPLHNEELYNLYSSPSIIRVFKSRWIRYSAACSTNGEKRNGFAILMGKPEGKRRLRRPRRRYMDNIKMDFGEIEMVWNGLIQDRDHWRLLVDTIINLRVL
jgi:hypothetical protein